MAYQQPKSRSCALEAGLRPGTDDLKPSLQLRSMHMAVPGPHDHTPPCPIDVTRSPHDDLVEPGPLPCPLAGEQHAVPGHRRVERIHKLTIARHRHRLRRARRSEEHTSELQSLAHLVCRLLLHEKQ